MINNFKPLVTALAISLATLLSSADADAAPRVEHVVDLPAVQVRPDAELAAELASMTIRDRVVTLATVHVRPTAEQLAERAMVVAREQAQALAAQVGAALANQAASVAKN